MSDRQIPLSEVIEQLRNELMASAEKGEGKSIRFSVEEAELEFEVGISKGIEGGGGVKFWVYNAEAKGRLSSEQTQRITLKLKAIDPSTGGSPNIAGEGNLPPELQ